jgi:hypothetical protein
MGFNAIQAIRCYTLKLMFWRWQIALGVALIATASFQAPFAHVHAGDSDQHHETGFVHTHLEVHHSHESPQTEIEGHDDDETAINLDWAPTIVKRFVVTYSGPIAFVPIQLTYIDLGTAPEFAPRAHSPPRLLLLPARAPPA